MIFLLAGGPLCWLGARALGRSRATTAPRGTLPRPGEIWWANVPFRDVDGDKIRPCVVLSGNGQYFSVLKVTSQDKSARSDHIEIPTRNWDRSATHNSFLDLSAAFQLHVTDFQRRAGAVDRATWQHIVRLHPVGQRGVAIPPPQPSGWRGPGYNVAVTSTMSLWAAFLSVAGLITCGLTAPFGAILGHLARADIRRTGKDGDLRAVRAIIIGWTLTGVLGLGWLCATQTLLPH